MRNPLILVVLTAAVAYPATGTAQDPGSIMQAMREKQLERWEGVDTYVVDQSLIGNRVQQVFQRATVEDTDGNTYDIFRHHPMQEDPCGFGADEPDLGDMTDEDLDQMDAAFEMTGDGMATEIENGLEAAGLPRGLLAATGSDPWATFDPRVMMRGQAAFLRAAAEGKRKGAAELAQPDVMQQDMQQFADSATLVGIESEDGRDAFHLRAEDLNLVQESDGQTFTIDSIDSWIDAEYYVPLRMRLEGVVDSGRESRPIVMEKIDQDYRNVPDSSMYESYRQVMRISGVMSPEEQKQMQEAQQQMAEFEQQMAQMPASQRDMIMRQMGPQMEMMKKMAASGGMEMETVVHSITVNHCGKPQSEQLMSAAGVIPVASAGAAAHSLPMDDDDVEVRPYYVDKEGIGVLRYSDPQGRAFEYKLVISGLTANPERPREVLVGSMGPYHGPDVAIYIGSLKMMGVPFDQIELELHEDEPYRPIVRFRPEIAPDKAEGMDDCGTVSSTGACSNTLPGNE